MPAPPSIIVPFIPAASTPAPTAATMVVITATTTATMVVITATATAATVIISVTTLPPVMWARAAAPSPVWSPVMPKELFPQIPINLLHMHKIAISTTIAAVLLILSAGCFTKISNWGEVDNNRAARVKAAQRAV